MTLFIDKTKFVGEIKIDFGSFDNFTDLAPQIQRRYLIRFLGFECYKALEAAEADPEFVNILDGVDDGFTDENGVLCEVPGLKEILLYFFFNDYQKEIQSFTSTLGEFEGMAENADRDQDKHLLVKKLVRAWNLGREKYLALGKYMVYQNEQTPDLYPGFEIAEIDKINSYDI